MAMADIPRGAILICHLRLLKMQLRRNARL
jgi:hypothetical protein